MPDLDSFWESFVAKSVLKYLFALFGTFPFPHQNKFPRILRKRKVAEDKFRFTTCSFVLLSPCKLNFQQSCTRRLTSQNYN